MTTTIGFIGLGLIGGSLAKAIRKAHPDYRLIAYNRSTKIAEQALEEGVIDRICQLQDTEFTQCRYIFLCAPVEVNISCLEHFCGNLSPDCILSDVGSVKGMIHSKVTELGLDTQFIGGHPMAGSEKTGFANSKAHLMENAYYILTPSENVSIDKITDYTDLVSSIGAIPLVLTHQEHDYITAGISHLPHIIAASLVNLVKELDNPKEHMKMIAAGGFKDITRIASSSPDMWQQICLENTKNISSVLDTYIRSLVQARCLIEAQDAQALYDLFSTSRDYRDSIDMAPRGPLKKVYDIYVDILDETGSIATIATILAMHQINIKNIGIIHNREFEQGALKIEFYEEEAKEQATVLLHKRNYIVYEG